MKKYFICLANSNKKSGRCVAGVEVEYFEENNKYKLITKDSFPIWIRPVSDTEAGELSLAIAGRIRILDIVQIELTTGNQDGYQSENFCFKPDSIKVISRIVLKDASLDVITDHSRENLFGNYGSNVSPVEIEQIRYSLVFIKVVNPVGYYKFNAFTGGNQLRIKFSYKEHYYDLPATDPVFIGKYYIDNSIFEKTTHIYFAISLGVIFNDAYYKLVAGVVMIP